MKEVMAVIRMNKINQTKEALSAQGINSLTCIKVTGRGRKKVNYDLIERMLEGEDEIVKTKEVSESITEGHRLIPKRMLITVVESENVKKVVNTIMDVNESGNPGDGKIFVLPVEEAYRVRTGETGKLAI
ncbi:MAG: P-II family nitrogen regulator [Halanaerobium sp.]